MPKFPELSTAAAYTIDEFCARNRISRRTLYNLWRDGIGPRIMKVGTRRLITVTAEAEWQAAREADAAAEQVAP